MKSQNQIKIEVLLKEVLQSNLLYTDRKITKDVAAEIREDIHSYINQMPEYIKNRYCDNKKGTVDKLYTLVVSIKSAIKYSSRTPA